MARAAKKRVEPTVPLLEWIAAGLGLLIALVLIGLVAWQAIDAKDEPVPRLRAEVVRVVKAGEFHLLDLKLTNDSARSAATVQVEATLTRGGEEIETSSATVDYVPGHSEAFGGILLREDPRAHSLEVKVAGFEIP